MHLPTPSSQVKFDANKVPFDLNLVKSNFTEIMSETFGQWLTAKREAAGLNQTELAVLSRVTKSTISLYEKDAVAQPRFKQLDKIAKALNISPDAIRRTFAERTAGLSKPQTPAEFVQRLRDMGFDIIFSAEQLDGLGPEDLQEMIDQIEANLLVKSRRRKK